MWGNEYIKDNNLWGISPINFTELRVDNKIYCTYVTDKLYNKEFSYNSLIKVGEYLLNALPNYVKKDTKLILVPESIVVNIPKFWDLDTETLKYVIFGDINIANTAINIFGEGLLKGEINSTQNNSFEIALVNFWNSTNLDIPFIWAVIADWVCKNKYALKKELCNKKLIHNYPDIPKLIHNSNLNIKIYYWYATGENYFETSSSKPNNRIFSLNFIKCLWLHESIKHNWQDFKVYIKHNGSSDCILEFFNYHEFKIQIYRKNISDDWYITVSNNKLILPPIASLPVDLYPISGFVKTDFKIECPQCTIETDLNILACRSEYFKTYKTFNYSVKAELSIDSQWDLRNLVNFIINCECEITDPELELQIADYYKCAQYKIYIDNWLKVNALRLYYNIYKLW